MKKRLGKGYSPKGWVLGNWAWEGILGKCPKCTLPLIRIIETGCSKVYYHADNVLCEVRK